MEINIEPLEKEQRQLGIWNLRVIKDGKTILAKDWEEEIRKNQYSASKSFTSAAVGIAQKEGLLSLDEGCARHLRMTFRKIPARI